MHTFDKVKAQKFLPVKLIPLSFVPSSAAPGPLHPGDRLLLPPWGHGGDLLRERGLQPCARPQVEAQRQEGARRVHAPLQQDGQRLLRAGVGGEDAQASGERNDASLA